MNFPTIFSSHQYSRASSDGVGYSADFVYELRRGAELFPVVGNYLVLFFDGVCSGPVSVRCRYDLNSHPPLARNPPKMTSEHQVALARAHHMSAPSNHISRAARQVVPAFLQKLYELRSSLDILALMEN